LRKSIHASRLSVGMLLCVISLQCITPLVLGVHGVGGIALAFLLEDAVTVGGEPVTCFGGGGIGHGLLCLHEVICRLCLSVWAWSSCWVRHCVPQVLQKSTSSSKSVTSEAYALAPWFLGKALSMACPHMCCAISRLRSSGSAFQKRAQPTVIPPAPRPATVPPPAKYEMKVNR
jgi:hypothetical protein